MLRRSTTSGTSHLVVGRLSLVSETSVMGRLSLLYRSLRGCMPGRNMIGALQCIKGRANPANDGKRKRSSKSKQATSPFAAQLVPLYYHHQVNIKPKKKPKNTPRSAPETKRSIENETLHLRHHRCCRRRRQRRNRHGQPHRRDERGHSDARTRR